MAEESDEIEKTYQRPTKPASFETRMAVVKDANLSWIHGLNVPIEESGVMLTITIMGRKIDFWPASDSYYLHSKNEYGIGIAGLVKKIKEFHKP